jgi:hypothetical protein
MTAIRYYRDGRRSDTEVIPDPSWTDVETTVRRMENYCFPIVQLNTTDDDEDEDVFNVIGGAGRWALFHMMGKWQFKDPSIADDEEVWLWASDQGYGCERSNIITDVEKVLRIVKAYYETGSYEGLDAVK